MKLLVYTRPRLKGFFHALGHLLTEPGGCVFMSDHRGSEAIDIMGHFYEFYRTGARGILEPEERRSVIRRCRFLRSLDFERAGRCVDAMSRAAQRILDEVQPDLVLGTVMDSYVLDVFDLVSRRYGLEYTGFLNNLINGYSRLTCRGELRPWRRVEEEEIDAALGALLRREYVPKMQRDFAWNFSPYTMVVTKYLKEKIKIAYYAAARLAKRDPLNFYYNTVSAPHCMSCQGLSYLFTPPRLADPDWRGHAQAARQRGVPVVYLPLQFYPECSIDYWNTVPAMADFYGVVERVLRTSGQGCTFLVKEHPSAVGLRHPDFYRAIVSRPEVWLVPSSIPSNEVLCHCDVVLTWTGSVGFEAAVRGLPLITFGDAYYDPGGYFRVLRTPEELDRIPVWVAQALASGGLDRKRRRELVRHMLSGLIPGYVFPVDFKPGRLRREVGELQRLAEGISAWCGTRVTGTRLPLSGADREG